MKIRLVLFFCMVPLFAGAAIYKSVDSQGNVVFSDKPSPGAKIIPEPLTPTYVPPSLQPVGAATTPAATAITSYYKEISIHKPTPGETLRDASGTLTIDLEVVPPLKVQEGHILVVAVDGNNLTSHDNATHLTISNLMPGTHTFKAQIMDATGQVQFTSRSITFHMQREVDSTSAKGTSTTPSDKQGQD